MAWHVASAWVVWGKGEGPWWLRGNIPVLVQGLPSLQVLGGSGEEQAAVPGASQKDVVWGRVCGDPSAGEVSPRQLLPERDVRLSHPDLSAPFLANVTRSSTLNWVPGLPPFPPHPATSTFPPKVVAGKIRPSHRWIRTTEMIRSTLFFLQAEKIEAQRERFW